MVDLILPEDGAPGWGAIVRAAFDSLNAGKPDVTDFSDPGSAVRAALDGEFMTAGELVFNVRDYGAVADGVSDDQPGIQAAIAAAQAKGRGVVYIPAGIYRLGAALTISGQNISLVGQGRGITLLRATTPNANVITIASGSTHVRIQSMSLDRIVTPTTGNGIDAASNGRLAYPMIRDLYLNNHFRGIRLGPTAFGNLDMVLVEGCTSDGIFMTNSSLDPTLQWTLSRVLVQANGGAGIRVLAQLFTPTQIALGNWDQIYTFANSTNGISIEGLSNVPIHGFRLSNSFVGEDGASVIRLDTHGGMHTISNVFVEGCGTRTTGPGLTTPASNSGHGIELTANNQTVSIVGGRVQTSSDSGIHSSAQAVLVSGVAIDGNGLNSASGAAANSGVFLNAGDALVSGCYIRGQQYGVWLINDDHTVVGNRITATTQAIGNTATLSSSLVANNRIVA